MNTDIKKYNFSLEKKDKEICDLLESVIDKELKFTESKIWHAHPVWFVDGNPIVGYSKLNDCIKLMFWSGVDFGETKLVSGTGKFKDASASYTEKDQVDVKDLKRWLKKSEQIQWDYKNIVKRKGKLIRLK